MPERTRSPWPAALAVCGVLVLVATASTLTGLVVEARQPAVRPQPPASAVPICRTEPAVQP